MSQTVQQVTITKCDGCRNEIRADVEHFCIEPGDYLTVHVPGKSSKAFSRLDFCDTTCIAKFFYDQQP